ncbi:MAG: AmmeMemoRadiSam system protein A [Brevinematales bacterium]|nr:AmmeMemoRadiSam system protein A [Brevinematales bacterium]
MEKLKLTGEQQQTLLKAVRVAIERELKVPSPAPVPAMDDDVFSGKFGLFVTLTIQGNLRGCIGYVEGVKPIREAVGDMAIQAAFHDPRFYPLSLKEYSGLDIEISILYPVEEVSDLEEIQVGRDGLIMEKGYRRGLLLPQVATEYGWDRTRFLNETCRKAGLEPFAWENGAKVYKFEAEIFNEEETGLK